MAESSDGLNFLAEARAVSNPSSSVCSMGRILVEIERDSPELAAQIRTALEPRSGISGKAISQTLARREYGGYTVSGQTVNRHRSRECIVCPDRKAA